MIKFDTDIASIVIASETPQRTQRQQLLIADSCLFLFW